MKMSMPDLNWSSVETRARSGASCTVRSRGGHDRHPLGCQPLLHRPRRGPARLRVGEQLGSVEAAAQELDITWSSLRETYLPRPGHADP
jgi:hypothetical protein